VKKLDILDAYIKFDMKGKEKFLIGHKKSEKKVEFESLRNESLCFERGTSIMFGPNGNLIIFDEFYKASLHVVFILPFQRDVDQMVITWNVHRVRKIIENGRFILFHMFLHKSSNLMRENLSK